jgi:hypothetical protein
MEEASSVLVTHPSPLESVAGGITFAEFADGTVFGSDRDKVLPWLKDQWSASLKEYEKLMEIYRSGGESALSRALVEESAADTVRGRSVRRNLRQLQTSKGITAVENELSRSLKLPE